MSKAQKKPVLKAEELLRAIFIDYEGNKPAPDAEEENRVLVSWSRHDLKHMVHVAPELDSRLEAVHRNAIKPIKQHFSRLGTPVPHKQARLYDVCELLRIPVVDKYGTGLVGKNLTKLRAKFKSGVTYKELSPELRRAWQQIVKHNRQDLLCMRDALGKVIGSPGCLTMGPRTKARKLYFLPVAKTGKLTIRL